MRTATSILSLFLLLVLSTGCGPDDGIDAAQKARHEELAKLPRAQYNKGGVSFSVAALPDLKPVQRDSVGWSGYMPETEENGQVIYYFLRGYGMDLADPQIRIEYIAKSLPNCATTEELFNWLKGVFVNEERQGVILSEGTTLATMDGQIVELLEIKQPQVMTNDSVMRSSKSMAYAYLDQGERFVALNFAAAEDDTYQQGLDLFKDLILSYRKE